MNDWAKCIFMRVIFVTVEEHLYSLYSVHGGIEFVPFNTEMCGSVSMLDRSFSYKRNVFLA